MAIKSLKIGAIISSSLLFKWPHLFPQFFYLFLLFSYNLKRFSSSIPALSTNGNFISAQSNVRKASWKASRVPSGSLRIESLSAQPKARELKFGKLTNRQLPQKSLNDFIKMKA
jgi:hypothetical protein